MRNCAVIIAVCLFLSPLSVSAQQPRSVPPASRLIISDKAVADVLAAEQPRIDERRDSVKNGAVIGAVIGAIALGGFVGWLCNMLQEPSDPSCVPGTLLYTGIGAGIGAAAGAGIDALMWRNSRVNSPLAPSNGPPRGVPFDSRSAFTTLSPTLAQGIRLPGVP